MTVREYLRQPLEAEERYKSRILLLEKLRAEVSLVKGMVYNRDKVMTSPSQTTATEHQVIEIVDLENELMNEAIELTNLRRKIIREIEGLDNERFERILVLRYVKGYNLSRISRKMSYCYQTIKNYHREALKQFAELYGFEYHNELTSQ